MTLKKSTKRFFIIIFVLIIFWISGFFIIKNFKENMEYYFTPTQINDKFNAAMINKKLRVGGLIVNGSIKKENNVINFTITDSKRLLYIIYNNSVTPPLFRENVGIIARGYLIDKDHFFAEQLIGKHDENYMPQTQ